ncbi:MAG: HIT domain-containing protein [Nanoarchaeota archaeon]|nr:HIT domain-containing protein [Nanoarchaeota archaeon]
MLSKEQIKQTKDQIIQQIESNFPEDKKESAKNQIMEMNNEDFLEFLKQNNLIKNSEDSLVQPCIFCSIVSGETKSYVIEENDDSIAVLEINPISKAHTIVIPRKHISSSEEIPPNTFSFAKKIAERIKTKFNPKDVTISSSNLFGHEIINILPIYENETLNSEKKKTTPQELENMQRILKPEKKVEKIKSQKTEKLSKQTRIPKRIP